MKFRGNREQLLEAVTVLSTVVAPRSIKPILLNLRLVVDPEGASLLATDLEVAVRYRVPLDSVEESGDVLLPAARFLGILRESGGSEVVVETEEGVVHISCGSGRFRIMGADPEEFPQVPVFEDDGALTIGRDPLRTLIRKTSFACAREKARYAFNAVRLEIESDEARMVASDGKRMAVKSVPLENPNDVSGGHLIPIKGLSTFDKVISEHDQELRLHLDERQVILKTSRAEVSSRLVEGAFPRYQAGIPKEFPLVVSFARDDLLSGLRRAAVLTSEESRSVRMTFEDGKVVLTSRAVDIGEARVEVEAQIEGEPIEVSFNPEYIIEGVRAMDGATIAIRISGRDTPALVEGEEDYIYVVMPVTRRAG
jgi:DNA polymerase-3 subunit beta